MFDIFGFIDPRTLRVFHVGCRNTPDHELWGGPSSCIPKDSKQPPLPTVVEDRCAGLGYKHGLVLLQSVDSAPLFAWVKWSLRFRRDLITTDWKKFTDETGLLVNSLRLRRALGQDIPTDARLQEDFFAFHNENGPLFESLLQGARSLKASGRKLFGIAAIFEEIRWYGPDTNKTDEFKINDHHGPFYARLLQMSDPTLCGLFAMRESVADDLILPDGRSWRDFAREHKTELRYVETPDLEDDNGDFRY
jgi:hypothetical protein